MKTYRTGVALFSVLFIGLGLAILIRTALEGGGIGFLLGALFVAVGSGRLYLLRQR